MNIAHCQGTLSGNTMITKTVRNHSSNEAHGTTTTTTKMREREKNEENWNEMKWNPLTFVQTAEI